METLKHKNSPENKTTQPKSKESSKVLVHWLKTDTKFPGKVTSVSSEGFYSVQFEDGDVDTRIDYCDMEMYGTRKLKPKALGKSMRKSTVPALDYDMERNK